MTDPLDRNVSWLMLLRIFGFSWVHIPTMLVFYQAAGLTLQEVFLLKAFFSLTIVCFEIPSGYLADVMGRKLSLLMGGIAFFVGIACYCVGDSLAVFLVAELCVGAAQSFISGADSALLFDSLEAQGRTAEYQRLEGRMVAASGYSEAAGGVLGAALASQDLLYPFWLQLIFLALFVFFTLRILEPPLGRIKAEKRFRRLCEHGWEIVRHRPVLREIMWISASNAAGTFTIVWFSQAYMERVQLPLPLFGIAWAVFHLSLGVSSHWASAVNDRLGMRGTFMLLTGGLVTGFLGLALTDSPLGLVFVVLLYLVRGMRVPVVRYYVNSFVSSDVRATTLSVNSFLFRIVFVCVGPILAGLADWLSLSAAFVTAAALFGIAEIILVRRLPKAA